MHFLAVKVYP